MSALDSSDSCPAASHNVEPATDGRSSGNGSATTSDRRSSVSQESQFWIALARESRLHIDNLRTFHHLALAKETTALSSQTQTIATSSGGTEKTGRF